MSGKINHLLRKMAYLMKLILLYLSWQKLRRNITNAEIILWNELRNGINGLKFRRQHPIGFYIADFYCHKIKMIIEVDRSIHNKREIKEFDKKRENDLKNLGYMVIRFTNQKFK